MVHKQIHIWLAGSKISLDEFDTFWDNEAYETALEAFQKGKGKYPHPETKCTFCHEMNLEYLPEDSFWFQWSRDMKRSQKMVEYLDLINMAAFTEACKLKKMGKANAAFGIYAEEIPHLQPQRCKSMVYIGCFEMAEK